VLFVAESIIEINNNNNNNRISIPPSVVTSELMKIFYTMAHAV